MTLLTASIKLREAWDAIWLTPRTRLLENQLMRQRQDFIDRLREKDATIADYKVRLAVAEADAMRERQEHSKPPTSTMKPVPAFDGPVSYQDDLLSSARKEPDQPAEPEENATDGTRSE